MKTFANMSVLTVVLSVAMSGGTAKADFNNQQVAQLAQILVDGVGGISNADLRELGVPRGPRAVILAQFNSIVRDASRIVELSGGPDNQVDNQIEDLARNIKLAANRVLNQADELNNDDLEELAKQIIEIADDIEDEVG